MKRIDNIKVIIYDRNDTDNRITQRFLSLENKIFESYIDENTLGSLVSDLQIKGYKSKEVIILKKFMGRIFQKCPGSRNMICCNYRLINTCFNCLYDCTYCFLNSYLNSFGIIQFTNLDNIKSEIAGFLDNGCSNLVYRIGTGEFTDSLMMDEVTGIAEFLINEIKIFKNIMIEFKTKSNNIDHLLNIENKHNTVLAWSLNTEKNINYYEKDTASLGERIEAAAKAGRAGFYLAFHFDPIIFSENFIGEYLDVVDMLFSNINCENIVWISLGCFRYSPGFKEIIRNKYPDERLTTGELFPGPDGKLKYLKPKRVNIYKILNQRINSYSKKPFVYLCMESSDVWYSVFNIEYKSSEELEYNFGNHLIDNFIRYPKNNNIID